MSAGENHSLKFEKWDDISFEPTPTYLIEGLYDLGTLVMSYGDSNVGKSNVVLSQAVAIASGTEWAGHRTRKGLVVFVSLEGGRGLRQRIIAFKKRGFTSLPIAIASQPMNLQDPDDALALVDLVRKAEEEFGEKCVMIVVDTLSRAMPGGDENAATDMTAVIRACDRVREATGATIHLIHHSGKSPTAGARGHSSLRAAVDTEIKVSKGTLAAEKQRDIEANLAFEFKFEVVEIGVDSNGNTISSVVSVVWRSSHGRSRTASQSKVHHVLLALRDLVFEKLGKEPSDPSHYDPTELPPEIATTWIASSDLKGRLHITQDDAEKARFRRWINELREGGFIDVDGGGGKEHQLRIKA